MEDNELSGMSNRFALGGVVEVLWIAGGREASEDDRDLPLVSGGDSPERLSML